MVAVDRVVLEKVRVIVDKVNELKKKLAQKFGNISASIKSAEFDNTSTTNVFKSPLKPRLVRGTVHSTLPLPFKTPKKDEVKGEATKQNEALQL